MSVIIAFATIEGQTGKIAQFVEEKVRDLGHDVTVFDAGDKSEDIKLKGADYVILAAPVHERRHPKTFEVFLSAQAKQLAARKTLLLSVSLNAAFPEGLEEAQEYVDEMKMRTEFEPDVQVLVAGAVRRSGYDYYASQVLRHVVLRGRDVDPNVDVHEFTDWEALAKALSAFVGTGPG